jgi:ABC-type multidrug transport system fused ATPase/permease subunit
MLIEKYFNNISFFKITSLKYIIGFPIIMFLVEMFSNLAIVAFANSSKLSSNQNPFLVFFYSFFGDDLYDLILIILVLLLFKQFIEALYEIFCNKYARILHGKFALSLLRIILTKTSIKKLYKNEIGIYIKLAGDDSYKAGYILVHLGQIVTSLINILFGFLIIYFINPFGLFILSVLMLIAVIPLKILYVKISSSNQLIQILQKRGNTEFIEAINSVRTLRLLNSTDYILDKYMNNMDLYSKTLFKMDFIKSILKHAPVIMMLLIMILAYSIGDNNEKKIDLNNIFALAIVTLKLFSSAGAFVNNLVHIITELKSIDEMLSFIEDGYKNKIIEKENNFSTSVINSLELRNLCYKYHNNVSVLDKVNFKFNKGYVYLICGKSGSGKSTLIDIISGLLEPSTGEILINDTIVKKTNTNFISIVEQSVKIVSGTIKENLCLGKIYPDEIMLQTLKVVKLFDFIMSLPYGLETKLEYMGGNLSGGQLQRFAIARALLRNPEILILDETTSGLDDATELEILEDLYKIFTNKILIIISHKSNNIKFHKRLELQC